MKCDICDYEREYELKTVYGVILCPNCHENHKRGLLPRELLDQFKSGRWKPYEPDDSHKLKVAKSRVRMAIAYRRKRQGITS